LDAVPKKYPNGGLRKVPIKTAESRADARAIQVGSFDNGGLNDEDIVSSRPDFSESKQTGTHAGVRAHAHIPAETLGRDMSRKNKVLKHYQFMMINR
jgi:hypothetical protein